MKKLALAFWELVSLILALVLMMAILHTAGVSGLWKAVLFLALFHALYRWRFGKWLN